MEDKNIFEENNVENVFDNNVKEKKKSSNILLFVLLPVIFIIGISIPILIMHNLNDKKNGNTNTNANTNTNTNISYKCPEEYELVNNKCIKELERNEPNIKSNCEKGYELKDNSCIRYEYSKETTDELTCANGYTKNYTAPDGKYYADVCYKVETSSPIIVDTYCPGGYSLIGNKCISQNTETVNGTAYATCPSRIGNISYNASTNLCYYTVSGSVCLSPHEDWVVEGGYSAGYVKCATNPIIKYKCPNGTISSSNNCTVVSEKETEPIYSKKCPNGYVSDAFVTTCTKTDFQMPIINTRCKLKDYVYNGKTCVKTITIEANKKPYCPDGYELKDNNCIKYDSQEPIIIKE